MCSPEVANHRGVVSASFVAYGGPAYDKTATVFISQSTAAGYHVGTAFVIQRTTLSIGYSDGPRVDYRFDFRTGSLNRSLYSGFQRRRTRAHVQTKR